MGIFDFLKRKESKTVQENKVKVDDAEYWETIAYAWLCDIEDAEGREAAWTRFFQAYPEWIVEELCEDFWRRIHRTHWHHKHHHQHHHHPYC